jgi:hypothetical protein
VGRALVLIGALLALSGAGSAGGAHLSRDVPVKATKADEVRPVASANAFAWAVRHWSSAHKSHYDTYVQVGKASAVRVNAPGTSSFPGGISGDTLVFEQWRHYHGQIVFYSLRRKVRFAPPRGVNSSRGSSWAPSISGNWLSYERLHSPTLSYLLRNLVTGEVIDLRSGPFAGPISRWHGPMVGGTQVNGPFAVLSLPRPFVYDISRRKSGLRDQGHGLSEVYFTPASVSKAGVVYAVGRWLGTGCGLGFDRAEGRTLSRFNVSDDPDTVVTTVPRGFEIGSSYAIDEGGHTAIYYTRRDCATGRSDIYKTIDPTPTG